MFLHQADREPSNYRNYPLGDSPFTEWLVEEEDKKKAGLTEADDGSVGVNWLGFCIRYLVNEKDVCSRERSLAPPLWE
jgi:hypothetical protein